MATNSLCVGTSGFSYPKWKGAFYPKKLPADQMLAYYAGKFRSVEINQTFRAMPSRAAMEKWAADTPADFRFVLKAPQRVTHMQRLKQADEFAAELDVAAEVLGKKLGPVLFQLPPNFKKDVDRLRGFLQAWPATRRSAFEFRHESWFDDEVYGLLRELGVALCLADNDDAEPPTAATADWGYLRLRRTEYDDDRLKRWVDYMSRQKWKRTFVFFKHEDTGTGPRFGERFLELAG